MSADFGNAGLGEEEPERETDGIAVDFARVNPFAAKDAAQASFETNFTAKVGLEPQGRIGNSTHESPETGALYSSRPLKNWTQVYSPAATTEGPGPVSSQE